MQYFTRLSKTIRDCTRQCKTMRDSTRLSETNWDLLTHGSHFGTLCGTFTFGSFLITLSNTLRTAGLRRSSFVSVLTKKCLCLLQLQLLMNITFLLFFSDKEKCLPLNQFNILEICRKKQRKSQFGNTVTSWKATFCQKLFSKMVRIFCKSGRWHPK